jgi:hypothetical protein
VLRATPSDDMAVVTFTTAFDEHAVAAKVNNRDELHDALRTKRHGAGANALQFGSNLAPFHDRTCFNTDSIVVRPWCETT